MMLTWIFHSDGGHFLTFYLYFKFVLYFIMSSGKESSFQQALHPENVLATAARALGDGGNVNNGCEAVALFCHACMIATDFKFLGLDEDKTICESVFFECFFLFSFFFFWRCQTGFQISNVLQLYIL